MNIIVTNTWTGTSGINEGERKVVFRKSYRLDEPGMKAGIKNYWDLLQKIGKSGRFNSVRNNFEKIKNNLSYIYSSQVDPVEFIAELYYGQKLSAKSIMERLHSLEVNYSSVDSVLCLLKTTLGWSLRESYDISSDTTKKKRQIIERRQGEVLKGFTLRESDRIRKKCNAIIDGFPKPAIEEVTLEKEKIYHGKPLTRALYILHHFRGIGIDEIASLYGNGIGLEVISQTLQDILNTIIEEEKLNISITIYKNSLIGQLKKKGVYRENGNLKRIK